jgi:hypothetical protein
MLWKILCCKYGRSKHFTWHFTSLTEHDEVYWECWFMAYVITLCPMHVLFSVTYEIMVWKDGRGNGCDLFQGTVLSFAWKCWGKL